MKRKITAGNGTVREHLHRRVDELLAEREQAHGDAQDQTEPRADGQTDRRPDHGDADVAQQVVMEQQIHERAPRGGR
jgi:hypothetical protein